MVLEDRAATGRDVIGVVRKGRFETKIRAELEYKFGAAAGTRDVPAPLVASFIAPLDFGGALDRRRRNVGLLPFAGRQKRDQPAVANFERIALAVEIIWILIDFVAQQYAHGLRPQIGRRRGDGEG